MNSVVGLMVLILCALAPAASLGQLHRDEAGRWLNEAGGNPFGDSRFNPMANPTFNPMADPTFNPMGDAFLGDDGATRFRSDP